MSAQEPIRTLRCPRCGRVASVAPWCARPICVHAWENVAPEIWDGDDSDGNGSKIEDSPNEAYRTPGDTWEEMLPVEIPNP